MMKKLIPFLLALGLSAPAHAQVVSQGNGGNSPWVTRIDQTGDHNDVNVLTLPLISFDGAQPVTGPQTDAEARAVQTATGTLDGNGDTVVLELNGASGMSAMFPDFNDFNGTVLFECSNAGGVANTWRQVQANTRLNFESSSPVQSAVQPSNYEWVLALAGGETHCRVRVTSYTSGTVDPVLTGTAVPSTVLQNVMFPVAGGPRPVAALMVGGQDIATPTARVPVVYNFNDATGSFGLIVRDMQGGFRVGQGMTGALDFGKAIGAQDADDVFQFAQIRDEPPASDDNGILVRQVGAIDTNASLADTSNSGTIDALDEDVELTVQGYSGLALQFTGTWDGALRVETSLNGTDWANLNVFNTSNPTTFTSEFTSNGVFFRAISSLVYVRVRANTWNSGSVDVQINATQSAGQGQSVAGPVSFPAGVSLTVDQGIGTANIGDSWFTKISDGTDGPAEVATLNEALAGSSFAVLARAHITDAGGTAADVTASNALKVDGSAVTQPVNVAQVAGNTVSTGVGASGTGTQRTASLIHDGTDTAQVTATGGGSLQVECTSGCGGAATFADNSAFTFGTTSITNVGFVFDDASPNTVTENSAATPRMSSNRVPYAQIRDAAGNERGANVNASNALLTDAATIAGTATAVNNGSASAGTQRVTIADDSTGEIRVADNAGNQIPSSTSEPAESDRGLFIREVHADPCRTGLTTHLPISLTANTQLIAASGSTHVYICSINLVVAAATNVAVVSGTGSTCGTSTAGVFGGSTAATGWNFTANGGLTFGNGDRMVGRTVDAGDALCILVSAANQTSGSITYVQQ